MNSTVSLDRIGIQTRVGWDLEDVVGDDIEFVPFNEDTLTC